MSIEDLSVEDDEIFNKVDEDAEVPADRFPL